MMNLEATQLVQELYRRSKHKVNTYVPDSTIGHDQLSYHKSTAQIRLLFGGNQSGKSHTAAYDCVCHARGISPPEWGQKEITGKNVEIWLISPQYITIKTGIYRHLKDMMPDWDKEKEGPRIVNHDLPSYIKVRRQDGYETTISCFSADGENREKFQAAAVDYIYIDEEIGKDIWEELQYRVLATGGKFSISATLVESYDWIVDLEEEADKGNPNIFITRLHTELNKYLDQQTVKLLSAKIDDDTKEYRFFGKSRRTQGLIYKNFTEDTHIVKPFKIPPEWPKWCAIDPGIRVCAVLWIAVGPNGRAYAYRELYIRNEPLWQIIVHLKQAEGWKLDLELSHKFNHYVWLEGKEEPEELVLRIIDPKARARSEAGEMSILDQLHTRYGVACTPADNSLRPGIEDCRFWLEPLADGQPAFVVFDTCQNFLQEIKGYRYRPKSTKKNQNEAIDEPIRKANHLMDCWRYIAREKPKWSDRLTDPQGYKEPLTAGEKISRRHRHLSESTNLISSVLGEGQW